MSPETEPHIEIVPVATQPIAMPDEDLQKVAFTIVYGGLKGGLGKSTSAWLTAIELARRTGQPVAAVCADPGSQTLYTAYQSALAQGFHVPFHVIAWQKPEGFVTGVRAEMQRLGARHLIVDVGGESPKILEQALILAGIIAEEHELGSSELIVPVAPNPPELWRLQTTFDAAARVEGLTPVPPTLSTMLVKAAIRARAAQESRKIFAERGWPVLRTQIPDNGFYKQCLAGVPEDGGWYGSMLSEIAGDLIEESAA